MSSIKMNCRQSGLNDSSLFSKNLEIIDTTDMSDE